MKLDTNVKQEAPPLRLGLSGLGGWLVLVQIGMYASMLLLIMTLFRDNLPALRSEDWELLTSKDSLFYDPLWKPLLIFETVANALLLVFIAYCLSNFYRKKAILPTLMIVFLSTSLLIGMADYGMVNQIDLVQEYDLLGPDSVRDLGRSAIACAIWIPYFRKSERVKNTFVR